MSTERFGSRARLHLASATVGVLVVSWGLALGRAQSAPATLGDPTLAGMGRGRVIAGAARQRILLFTFDDGPSVETTPTLLDTLDREHVKALFFVVGHRIAARGRMHQRQRAILQDIVRRGHHVASHSVTHRILPSLGPADARREMEQNAQLIQEVVGQRPWIFRPPGGGRSRRVDEMLEAAGYTIMLWNIGTADPFLRDARTVASTFGRVLERRQRMGERGGVILLHDTHRWSVEAVPLILADIRRRNCAAMAANEELFLLLDDPTPFFAARGEHDAHGLEAPPGALPDSEYAARQAQERQRAQGYCRAAR